MNYAYASGKHCHTTAHFLATGLGFPLLLWKFFWLWWWFYAVHVRSVVRVGRTIHLLLRICVFSIVIIILFL
jgi:hypothetical protein